MEIKIFWRRLKELLVWFMYRLNEILNATASIYVLFEYEYLNVVFIDVNYLYFYERCKYRR